MFFKIFFSTFFYSDVSGSVMSTEPRNEWKQQYWRLLLEKCRLAYVTLAGESKKTGPSTAEISLNCLRMAALIWSSLDPPGLPLPGSIPRPQQSNVSLQTHVLGLAGDVYFSMVQNWNRVSSASESTEENPFDDQLVQLLGDFQSGTALKADYFPYPSSLHESLQLSLEHYRLALSSFGPLEGGSASDFLSLAKRLGNVCNEMGVFFMSKASGNTSSFNDIIKHYVLIHLISNV